MFINWRLVSNFSRLCGRARINSVLNHFVSFGLRNMMVIVFSQMSNLITVSYPVYYLSSFQSRSRFMNRLRGTSGIYY
jgi:hypothetical protein